MNKQVTNHTPGPWEIDDTTLYRGEEMIKCQNGRYIAAITERYNGKVYDDVQTTANSKLIAAAPLILEVLMEIIDQYDKLPEARDHYDFQDSVNIRGRLAIQKAIG